MDKQVRALLDALVADPGYITGRRAFPRTVTDDDAVALTAALHTVHDAAATNRAATARRRHLPLACVQGCSACCAQPVLVFRPEALRIARWLLAPAQAAVKQQFLDAYAGWKAQVGDTPAELGAHLAADRQDAYNQAFFAHWRRAIPCAFNHAGLCSIYPVRPLACRDAHAIGTAEHCTGHSENQTPGLQSDEHDAWMQRARAALRAAHNALGLRRAPPGSVCDEVHALVTAV